MEKVSTMRDFQVCGKLGEGAFAEVYKVIRKGDGQTYAMKKIKLNRLKEKERENALNEVRILASYDGENIIQFKESFYDEPSSTLCIVMEFAGQGDILKIVQNHTKKRTNIPEEEIWKALVHISQGLKSLHDKKVLHRDLKCANIFITSDGLYKLGDLNVSKVLKKDLAHTQTGTPYYASPEVWKDKPYGFKADIWSLGCVLYEMAAQRPPFTAVDVPSLYKKIMTGYFQRIPTVYSNDLANMIASLLKLAPEQRPNVYDILSNKAVHKNYKGVLNIEASDNEEKDDFLLKTFKVNHRNLKAIQGVLPKANYDGSLRNSRCRVNSTEKKSEQASKPIQAPSIPSKPVIALVQPEVKPIGSNMPSEGHKERAPEEVSKQAIENYLQMKRKFEEKQRAIQIAKMKEEAMNLVHKRERVQSACRMRTPSPKERETLTSKQNIPIPLSIKPVRKEEVQNAARHPPKPIQLTPNYAVRLPPKPENKIRSNNSIVRQEGSRDCPQDGSRDYSTERDRSKENLRRAGQRVMSEQSKEPVRIVRSSSVQKIVYPSWWME